MKPPTDSELVTFLAENGMGYRYSESLGGVPHWILPDSDIAAIPCEDFDPLTDANDTLMLIEAMREKGWCTSLENDRSASDGSDGQNWWVCVLVKIEHCRTKITSILADTPQRAVCLACYKALKAIKEKE